MLFPKQLPLPQLFKSHLSSLVEQLMATEQTSPHGLTYIATQSLIQLTAHVIPTPTYQFIYTSLMSIILPPPVTRSLSTHAILPG